MGRERGRPGGKGAKAKRAILKGGIVEKGHLIPANWLTMAPLQMAPHPPVKDQSWKH